MLEFEEFSYSSHLIALQVEKLIKELPAADLSNGHDVNYAENGIETGSSLSMRETQSMLLERIASEMNRLKFYIAHAQVRVSLFFDQHFIVNITNPPIGKKSLLFDNLIYIFGDTYNLLSLYPICLSHL